MDKIYFENFACIDDVFDNFGVPCEDRHGIEMIYASYDCPPYEGYAHVIFVRDGKIYEVNGSHCSCFGLEDQWQPEETSAIALLARPNISDEAKANIKEFYKNLMSFL
jgi:hypothetical protein